MRSPRKSRRSRRRNSRASQRSRNKRRSRTNKRFRSSEIVKCAGDIATLYNKVVEQNEQSPDEIPKCLHALNTATEALRKQEENGELIRFQGQKALMFASLTIGNMIKKHFDKLNRGHVAMNMLPPRELALYGIDYYEYAETLKNKYNIQTPHTVNNKNKKYLEILSEQSLKSTNSTIIQNISEKPLQQRLRVTSPTSVIPVSYSIPSQIVTSEGTFSIDVPEVAVRDISYEITDSGIRMNKFTPFRKIFRQGTWQTGPHSATDEHGWRTGDAVFMLHEDFNPYAAPGQTCRDKCLTGTLFKEYGCLECFPVDLKIAGLWSALATEYTKTKMIIDAFDNVKLDEDPKTGNVKVELTYHYRATTAAFHGLIGYLSKFSENNGLGPCLTQENLFDSSKAVYLDVDSIKVNKYVDKHGNTYKRMFKYNSITSTEFVHVTTGEKLDPQRIDEMWRAEHLNMKTIYFDDKDGLPFKLVFTVSAKGNEWVELKLYPLGMIVPLYFLFEDEQETDIIVGRIQGENVLGFKRKDEYVDALGRTIRHKYFDLKDALPYKLPSDKFNKETLRQFCGYVRDPKR